MTTAAVPARGRGKKAKKKRPLVNGHPIHFRRTQQLVWTGLSILLGAGFIAGLYWLVLQQNYLPLFHLLGFHPHVSGSLKLWWDNGMGGLVRSVRWVFYRHGVRDGGEPALWTMVGATLLGKASTHPRLLPGWMLALAPVLLLTLIVLGTLGITWLTQFGPLSHVPNPLSWQEIALGALLGRMLHFLWAPIGNTVRYRVADNAAARAGVPLWVRRPLLPPVWRELWAELRARYEASGVSLKERTDKHRQSVVLVPAIVTVFLIIAIIGDLAKWGVAHGLHIPGMN
jgi:hypothetical protein